MTSAAFDDEDSERFNFINNYDEDDDDVLECWEDVEDEEEKAEKEKKAAEAEALRKQQEKEKRLAKREEERRKALEEEERLNAPSMTKADLEQAQRDSDAAHAEDLFGEPTVAVRKGVDSYVPVNPDDFNELKERLITKLRPFEKDEGFVNFVKDLASELALEMTSEDIRKVSTSLTNIAHEKGRLEREAAKKTTTKSKKSLKITKKSSGKDDMLEDFSQGGYGFDGDDGGDDFM